MKQKIEESKKERIIRDTYDIRKTLRAGLAFLLVLVFVVIIWGGLFRDTKLAFHGMLVVLAVQVFYWAIIVTGLFIMPMFERTDLILERLERLETLLEKEGGLNNQEAQDEGDGVTQ